MTRFEVAVIRDHRAQGARGSAGVSFGFNTNFRMTSQTVNGTALAFGYDLDGLLTGAGALTLTLDTQNGHLNGTTLGAMTDSHGYDTNGLFASYTAKFNGASLSLSGGAHAPPRRSRPHRSDTSSSLSVAFMPDRIIEEPEARYLRVEARAHPRQG